VSARPGIGRLDLVRIRLPLIRPWTTAAGTVSEREVLLVRVELGGAVGWGECVAQAEPTYTSEYVDGAADVLRRHLVPLLATTRPAAANAVAPALARVKGHPMAKAAIETAVLDAQLRVGGLNLAEHLRSLSRLGSTPDVPRTVVAGVAVGIAGSLPALLEEVGKRVEEGYRRVKLKVHPGWDLAPVRAVREAWPHLALQVDANGAYAALAPGDAQAVLKRLDDQNLLLIEQPLGDDDLLGHRALSDALDTPICLDEAITSLAVAETALALGACQVVNIKAGRVGGYLEAVRIHDACADGGVPVWCGGMLETGIGRAANLALATLDNFSLPGDLSASERFWATDIVTDPAVLRPDGTIAVPAGPGLGIEVKDLAPWTAAAERLI
jgi:o-succinylbenzoate synthase